MKHRLTNTAATPFRRERGEHHELTQERHPTRAPVALRTSLSLRYHRAGRRGRAVVAEDTRQTPVVRREATAVSASPRGFRPDVEGLRAVAVVLVLIYHAGLTFVPGGFVGVDVFFVISGFLITSLLIREAERSGTVSLRNFYARRAKRLLPAAALVLATTALLALLVVPRTRWADVGGDIAAAALYFVNWRFAANETDYLAEDASVSPVQHFWSLAVEEQFYFVWPLLLLLAVLIARRVGWSLRRTMCLGLAVIALPSFAWSIVQTAAEPQSSFFVTTTRMWELAIGAVVAIGITRLQRLPRSYAIGLGWLGLAAIVVSGLWFTTATAWPGHAALLPTLGTAAVIAAGASAGAGGPQALLGTRPFTWVGGLSYSLYLWHWPLIVFASVYFDGLSPAGGVAVALFSFVPAWLTLRLVENPVRFSPRFASDTSAVRSWVTLRMGAALTAAGVVAGVALVGATSFAKEPAVPFARGAAVLEPTSREYRPDTKTEGVTPDPLDAVSDVPDSYERGCQVDQTSTEPVSCTYGDPDGDVEVALVGDSKALQWIPALDDIGERRGWRVRTFTKSSCPFTEATIEQRGKPYDNCRQWGDNVEAELLDDPPDAVLTSQIRAIALADPADTASGQWRDVMIAALRERWSDLTAAGIDVAVLRDNPRPPEELVPVYECVDQHRDDLMSCAFPRKAGEWLSGARAQLPAAKNTPKVSLIDMNDYICPGDVCPPVVGDVLVYRQGAHLTKTYVETLEPLLEKRLAPVVES
ncbi:MAG: acyltransferase family protein [Actinophytocola sp.]|nr:acyltransferase family protein [Actinophytocola sp.]